MNAQGEEFGRPGAFPVVMERIACPVCGADRSRAERRLHGYDLVKCRDCGMVYCNPRPDEATLARAYGELQGEAYDDFFGLDVLDAHAWLHEQTQSQIDNYRRIASRIYSFKKGGRLLDVGCSNGRFLRVAREFGFSVWGVEIAPNEDSVKTELNIFQGSLEQAAFEQGFFDVVFSQAVLEHVVRPGRLIESAHRILKPDGLLVLAGIPNYHSFTILLNVDRFHSNMPPHHLNYFTPATLGMLLRRSNFTPIDKRCWGVSETILYKTGWGKEHLKDKDNVRENKAVNSLGKLMYRPINGIMNLFNIGSVIEYYARKNETVP